jgi:hypothetical protein
MNEFSVSILEYLGKVEDGILVLISLVHNKKYYEGTFFYTNKDMILTISEDLEEIIGDIKFHPEYRPILAKLIKDVVPFEEMCDKIDPVNFERWIKGMWKELSDDEDVEYIPRSQIKN